MVTFKKANPFANRGATAEKAMAKFLDKWSSAPNREANRLTDTKAAGRIIKAAAADFEYFTPMGHGLIEVKQTEHDYRLARDKVPQLPRLRKRTHCGGICLIAVYHSTTECWRVVDADYLASTGDKGSWNLTLIHPHEDLAEAMFEACPSVFDLPV